MHRSPNHTSPECPACSPMYRYSFSRSWGDILQQHATRSIHQAASIAVAEVSCKYVTISQTYIYPYLNMLCSASECRMIVCCCDLVCLQVSTCRLNSFYTYSKHMMFCMFYVCIFAYVCVSDSLLMEPSEAEHSIFGMRVYVLLGQDLKFMFKKVTASASASNHIWRLWSCSLKGINTSFLIPAELSLPTRRATAPAPPEGRAGPASYTASSDATTIANLPSQALDSIQLTQLYKPAVAP